MASPTTSEVTQIRTLRVGEILLSLKAVSLVQVEAALAKQAELQVAGPGAPPRPRLGELLVESKACSAADVGRALGVQSGLTWIDDIDARAIESDLLAKLPIAFAKQNELVPLRRVEGAIEVASANPLDVLPIDDLRVLLGSPIRVLVAQPKVIIDSINAAYDRRASAADAMMEGMAEGEDLGNLASALDEPVDLLDADDEAPIIRLVNSLLFQAVKDRASDIHVEPFERDVSVRFRIDGLLYDVLKPPRRFHPTIVARIKVMSGLDIAEKRLPRMAGCDSGSRGATSTSACRSCRPSSASGPCSGSSTAPARC